MYESEEAKKERTDYEYISCGLSLDEDRITKEREEENGGNIVNFDYTSYDLRPDRDKFIITARGYRPLT